MVTLSPFSNSPKTVGSVTQLRIYPIKSCRGIQITSSFLTKRGLDLDRRWMFVDGSTNKFITIRDISELTLIDTAFTGSRGGDDEQLVISIRNTDKSVIVPARPTEQWLAANATLAEVDIWEYDTDGYVYSDEINSVFTEFFKKPVKLVYKGPTPRVLRGNGAPDVLGREQYTDFPDVLPLLIANEGSLLELNGRLRKKGVDEISIERFRPNVVVDLEGAEAWSEDSWKTVRIVNQETSGVASLFGGSGLDIDVAARCARCQVPNVNPETGEKNAHEPWDTLVSYRRVDEGIKWKPCFGMLSVPRSEGAVAVGMRFEVLEETEDHKYIKGF
ncbi:Mitochondrial amidoxime reducing component [Lachnellula suecica]|uniref:Mitochondrial amidoxime reducing component n=1 Tax=Lachnellula suecica TaxID=602035 RepID=A0A8T9C9U9_9HELO|nr:Mitochondrial amidoxime reducing component [Lachnellula suecica]